MFFTCEERTLAEAGGKLASTQIITCVHTYTVAERRWSGSKIRSATNGSNTQFFASPLKLRTSNHLCPQEMADPPASAPRMCEHICGSGAGMSKSARLRSASHPRICERSLTHLRLDKMAAIWQMIISDALLQMEIFFILIQISRKFVPKVPINNNPTLV